MSKSSPKPFFDIILPWKNKTNLLKLIDLATPAHPQRIATVNPEFILEAQRNQAFQRALSTMTACSIDGFGLLIMQKLWAILTHTPNVNELYPGATLVHDLFVRYQKGEKSFFLLGGQPGVAQAAAGKLLQLYPQLRIVGYDDGGLIPLQVKELDPLIVKKIQQTKPDILLIAFGAPKQELWISLAANLLSVPVMIGVGGTFNFYSQKKRAPQFLQTLHLEWLYRGLTEKGHFKRLWQAVVLFPIQSLLWMVGQLFKKA